MTIFIIYPKKYEFEHIVVKLMSRISKLCGIMVMKLIILKNIFKKDKTQKMWIIYFKNI